MTIHTSRRDVLKGGGALVVSFSLAGAPREAIAQGAKPVTTTEVDSFLAIDAKGMVTVYSGKVDLGTGIATALPQMVAEELDVPLPMIKLIQGDTALTPDQGTTWGSLSIQIGGMQLRNAAATAKAALLDEAAKRLGAKKEELRVADGVVSAGNKRISYGELIGGKSFALKLDHTKPATGKDPKDYKIVGKAVPRVDIPDKVTGRFTYMQDFRVPGMLHGRVIRPPAIGAKLESVDEGFDRGHRRRGQGRAPGQFHRRRCRERVGRDQGGAEAQGGMVEVGDAARGGGAMGLCAREQGRQGRGNEQRRQYRRGHRQRGDQDTKSHLRFCHPHPRLDRAILRGGGVQGRQAHILVGLAGDPQFAQAARHNVRLPVDNVRCIYLEGSGCYGRNGHEDAAADAALLAKAVGRPVRVQWSRADEHGWDPKGPPTLIDIRAAVDSSGGVTAWESEFFIPQQTANGFHVPLVAATLTGMPADDHIAPGNIFQNSAIPYKFANVKTVCRRLETTPFRPSWIRTPGRMQNTYANECFMDELAAVANADPVEFRLKYLDPNDKRGIEVLNRAAALAKWDRRPSPKHDQSGDVFSGRGVAYCKYELARTYIAAVAEVEVKRLDWRHKGDEILPCP